MLVSTLQSEMLSIKSRLTERETQFNDVAPPVQEQRAQVNQGADGL